jgi:hypothetical protein
MPEKEKFIKCIDKISAGLEKGKNLIDEMQIGEFDRERNSIVKEMEGILQTERTLKIGIVGEVKAGKSSFLNALIFDGEDVLPKAATPMTAALTKLNYSESPSAKIFFYKKHDWEAIQSWSDNYEKAIDEKFREAMENYEKSKLTKVKGLLVENKPTRESIEKAYGGTLPKTASGCRELTKMVEECGLRPADILGKEKDIPYSDLNEYIGAKGKYTPLVSHTELYINNPLLEDIEIIDTPGLNDAVVSRSQKTKDFLIKCDVVFLLSYVGEFLLTEDISFIVNTLPNEAIKEAVIVGSKFDSGILQYKEKTAEFEKALSVSRGSFNGQAKNNIEKCANGPHPPVIDNLKAALPPFYVSSLMYAIAKKKEAGKPLNKEEEGILNQLKSRFSGFSDTTEFLFDLSGIEYIKNKKLLKIKDNKEPIIKEKVNGFLESQINKLTKILGDIKNNAQNNLNVLKDNDVNSLRDRLEKLNNVLGSISPKISRVFNDNIMEIKKNFKEIAMEILNDIDKFNKEVEISTRTQENSYETGHLWWKKHHITYTKINSANISDVIVNIRRYVTAIQEILLHSYDTLLDRQGLKDSITAIVAQAHDLGDINFNEDEILLPIEKMLNDFAVSPISIDTKRYNEMIYSEFSSEAHGFLGVIGKLFHNNNGVVEDKDINRLILMQENVLQEIAKDINGEIEKESESMVNAILQRSETFISDIKAGITKNYEKIAQLLENKEENLERFDEFVETVTEYQRNLRAL